MDKYIVNVNGKNRFYFTEQLYEINKCREDFVYFVETYLLKAPLHAHQLPYVESLLNPTDIQLPHMGRGAGKTYLAIAYQLWLCTFNQNTICAYYSPYNSGKHALTLLHELSKLIPKWMIESCKRYMDGVRFENGSRVIFGKNFLGLRINSFIVDNADSIGEEDRRVINMTGFPAVQGKYRARIICDKL